MGVFVDSEQKLIFESFWLRFGSICLHFSSRVPLLHATPSTFCLSDFTNPTFLFVWYYNSKLFSLWGVTFVLFVCLILHPILSFQSYNTNLTPPIFLSDDFTSYFSFVKSHDFNLICLSDFTPQFFVCHIYSSNFFVCLILHLQVFCSSDLTLFYCQHCFTWRICIVQFLILYRCLQHE